MTGEPARRSEIKRIDGRGGGRRRRLRTGRPAGRQRAGEYGCNEAHHHFSLRFLNSRSVCLQADSVLAQRAKAEAGHDECSQSLCGLANNAELNSTRSVPNGWPRHCGRKPSRMTWPLVHLHIERRGLALKILLADQIARQKRRPRLLILRQHASGEALERLEHRAAIDEDGRLCGHARHDRVRRVRRHLDERPSAGSSSSGLRPATTFLHGQLELRDRERARAAETHDSAAGRARTGRTEPDRRRSRGPRTRAARRTATAAGPAPRPRPAAAALYGNPCILGQNHDVHLLPRAARENRRAGA